MKTSRKAAVLIASLAVSMNAATLVGIVPVEFQVGKQVQRAETCRVTPQRPGVIVLKTADGATVGVRILQVQTESERISQNSLTFTRNAKGNFELAGYCMSNVGCGEPAVAKSGGTRWSRASENLSDATRRN